MTQKNLNLKFNAISAIIDSPDSELKTIFIQAVRLIKFDPQIISRIQKDVNCIALKKKADRLKDRDWFFDQYGLLPIFDSPQKISAYEPENLRLLHGRPRLLDAESVFLLMMCRAHLNSVSSKVATDRLRDSILIKRYFEARGMRLPSSNTILDYINAITEQTHDYIYHAQIKMIVQLELDSMTTFALDSFSVSGNTEWPTDSRIMVKLLNRVYRLGSYKLLKYRLPGFEQDSFPGWLKKLHQLNFKLDNTCGKAKSKGKVKKLYRQFLKVVDKLLLGMIRDVSEYLPTWEKMDERAPSQERMKQAIVDQIVSDIEGVIRVYQYTEDRVFHEIKLSSPEKILSLSDESVAFIKKGGREAVIGYKPQISRSKNGFITAFEVEQGNHGDSTRLLSMVEKHIKATHKIPETVTVDDGYSNKKVRKELKEMGVKVVSINGSKGKKITPEKEWESAAYKEARNGRSAVESIISTLRSKFHLSRFTRRGIERVRAELTEKVIAHNFWRIAYLDNKSRLKKVA